MTCRIGPAAAHAVAPLEASRTWPRTWLSPDTRLSRACGHTEEMNDSGVSAVANIKHISVVENLCAFLNGLRFGALGRSRVGINQRVREGCSIDVTEVADAIAAGPLRGKEPDRPLR